MPKSLSVYNAASYATDAEEKRYGEAYRETRRTLDELIELLIIKQEYASTNAEKIKIARQRRLLLNERDSLVQARIDYNNQDAVMTPPTPRQVQAILNISKQAVALTAQNAKLSTILQIATKVLGEFEEIQIL